MPPPPASDVGRRFVDLHLHSTASDGMLAPAAVVRAAAAAGLSAMALTDHDTLAGVPEAALEAEKVGLELVPGVELSAHENDREVHLLGLHISVPGKIEKRLIELRSSRERRAVAIVERLVSLGKAIEMDQVLAESNGAAIGRPHIARVLVRAGHVGDVKQAFDLYLGQGRSCFVAKEHLSVTDAVAMVHESGGLVFVAHPASDGTLERFETMKRAGVDGVEVLHPGHSAEDRRRIATLADHLGLLRTGGSDWHGVSGGRRQIGAEHVPYEWLQIQRAALVAVQ